MTFEYTPPKYAQLIAELERRIDSGEYPPGSPLPSEHQLMAEFGMARPTVVKALGVLRDQGWIVTHQGKGRFVRGRPAMPTAQQVRTGRELLDRNEAQVSGRLLSAGEVEAPNRIATYLGIKPASPVVLRRSLVEHDGEPIEISSAWLPVAVADGTALAESADLKHGVRRYVESAAGASLDHIVEHVTARNPTKEECGLLGVKSSAALLTVYAVACDATGRPWVVVETVLPGDRHELEDAYPIL
ncbi:GntR family transcriptional regulator [Microtetraspora sp. NBRC 13810]|uniref:GntR family transcriptional regulator n=1 Tax=Microtetraspora sp. NBRC 13810 TaxID=3030990 RepID=UPI0024A4C7F1|nr:GntR family transcriptional regulator [Microtetraspora sp. NBRC 13810]GLW10315.1 GntR family transcriptional regulator [Microtetraspora sp. NBRC 13810]